MIPGVSQFPKIPRFSRILWITGGSWPLALRIPRVSWLFNPEVPRDRLVTKDHWGNLVWLLRSPDDPWGLLVPEDPGVSCLLRSPGVSWLLRILGVSRQLMILSWGQLTAGYPWDLLDPKVLWGNMEPAYS